jgi:hypothetical protein
MKQLGLFDNEQKLKPCPFCGSDVELVYMDIVCHGCSSITRFMLCSIESHARRIWNSRNDPSTKKEFSEL